MARVEEDGDSGTAGTATPATGRSGRGSAGRDRPRVVTEESLAELALGPFLDDLLARIRDALAADTVVILLAEPDQSELYAAAVLDFEEEISERVRVPVGKGFAGRIAATGKPVVIEDLEHADAVNHLLRKRGLTSLLGVPLRLDDDVVGVLHVGSVAPRVFGPADIEVLEGIGERIALAIGRARAHQAERRAHERLAFLAEVSHVLSSSLDHEETLARLGRLSVPRLADSYVVMLVDGGRLVPAGIAHSDPEGLEALEELVRRYPPARDEPHGAGRVARTGEAELVTAVTDETLTAEARDDDHLALLRRLGPRSSVVVPLRVADRTLGALALAVGPSGRTFGADDLRLAEDVGRRAATAIENSLLHRAEHEARARAELLQGVTERLAGARTQREVADVLVREGVSALGAAAGWVALLGPEGRELELMAAVGYPPDVVEQYRSIPVESAIGAQDILVHGRQTWLESAEEVVARFPEHAPAYVRMGYEALAVVPLEVGGVRTGLVALNFPERTSFAQGERAVLLAVVGQCSQALERARLLDALAERANAAVVLAHVDDGVFQVGADGSVRYWNPAAEHLTGIAAGAAVGRQVGELLGGWEEASAAIEVGTRPGAATSGEAVPLVVAGEERWLAVAGVRTPDGTVYAFRDLTSERELERARRDFLSTASHELRTPLSAVYGASLTLVHRDLDEEQRDAMLEMIVRECDRLTRIVEDLLLANGLDLDHVHVALASADAVALAQEVVSVRGSTLPDGLTLAVESNGGAFEVACDPERLRQVLLNLVDNAVKYSPDGGRIRLAVAADDRVVRFVVADEGIGIPAGEQRRIFEKFYRLDPELRRGVGGSGLGLYISRELVRRMDGRIEVESEPGRGSRFVVELPLAR